MTAPWAAVSDVDIDGDFTQNVVGAQVDGDLVQTMITYVRGCPTMYLSSTEVTERVACYVPAHNHDLVVKALYMDHAVVLIGPRGSGRETTAIAAIRHLRPGIPIRRFSLDEEDSEEIDAKRACGYLIHAEDGLTRLGRCAEAVRASGGYLAVVTDREMQQHAAYIPSITIEPPDPVQVYKRWVTARNLTEWPDWDQAPVLLEGASPAAARRLADLVDQVIQRDGTLAAQQAEVGQAYRRWDDKLRKWFDEHREPHERALLIAAATLPSAAEEAYVYSAASSLAERLHIDMNGGGLAWCPVTGLRTLLEAEHVEGRIVFRRTGYAESALRHALADYPLARPDLLAWLAALPTHEAATYGMGDTVAATFADLAAEHDAAQRITETARKWGKDDLPDLTYIALSRTCLHPRVGGQVRQALYDWSRAARTPQTLKLAIARVCQPLGQTYPSIALTRLKHLATHGNRQVVDEVIAAAQDLSSHGHHHTVITAALDWCEETNPEILSTHARQRRRRAGAMLFLQMARPITESGVPEIFDGDQIVEPTSCTPGWRAILDFYGRPGLPSSVIEEAVCRWLDTALSHAYMREQIGTVFITATTPPHPPWGSVSTVEGRTADLTTAKIMIGIVRRWAATDRTDPIRRQIKEHIVIPLTQPRWLRVVKMSYVKLRTLFNAARTRFNAARKS